MTLSAICRGLLPVLVCVILAAGAPGGCANVDTDKSFNELFPEILKKAQIARPEEAAAELFETTSPDARRAAIQYFQTKKYGFEPVYMRVYKVLTTDPSPMVRSQAIRALGASRNPEAVEFLVKALKDSVPEVRRDAAAALKETRSAEAIPAMVESLKGDEDAQVRIYLAQAMKGLHDPRVFRALAEAMDDSDVAVVHWAHRSLKETANAPDLPKDARSAMEWVNQRYPQQS